MQRLLVLHIVPLLFAVLCGSAWAERQYWAAMSSYADPEDAETAMAAAAPKFSERLAVIGASTSKGYYYRIASGPRSNFAPW